MKTLLTVPDNLVSFLNDTVDDSIFPHSDPKEGKVGSGGGTVNLLFACFQKEKIGEKNSSFETWLPQEKRIIIHAGGQSRRLPAYAPTGKILTPIPVIRWERGQQMDQTLFDLQSPLLNEILEKAPNRLNTLIASGDVLVRTEDHLPKIPEADVVCFGLWEQPEKASNHGVFFCKRQDPTVLEFMIQKPAQEKIQELAHEYIFLIDVGIWLLSEKAIQILFKKCGWLENQNLFRNKTPDYYDMYGSFGKALGQNPMLNEADINELRVAIVPLPKGEFYHFGTSAELIESTTRLQNLVVDQREIYHHKIKPHPSIFTQNALTKYPFSSKNHAIWIENAVVPDSWQLSERNIITGVPENTWNLKLSAGTCLDMIPVGQNKWCIRPYGFEDKFSGKTGEFQTTWMNRPAKTWFLSRKLLIEESVQDTDIQFAPIFPIVDEIDNSTGAYIQWLIEEFPDENPYFNQKYNESVKYSAAEISENAEFLSISLQQKRFHAQNLEAVAKNYRQSIFYQLDLNHTAQLFSLSKLPLPPTLPDHETLMTKIHDQMFRARVSGDKAYEINAFSLLRESIIQSARQQPVTPKLSIHSDQIVWGRSPVRLDLAGGWTDTPPYCMIHGGKVVNVAVELNGQPPLQCFIKPSHEFKIILRSIDLGAREDIETFEDLNDYNKVGTSFAISKAALCLAGFHPEFGGNHFKTLIEQLKDLGSGIEISLLSAVPKGSGLGTSSILASTVLAAISDMFGLLWDKEEICVRTLVLEQMLTTGGGWQDQYGGVFQGIKLLESDPGIIQKPKVRWAPDFLFRETINSASVLLYYTGITRIAKNILAEIVRGMFLNSGTHLSILKEMKHHAIETYDAIQLGLWEVVAQKIEYSWQLNQRLDGGTNTVEIQAILNRISDLMLGSKLLGAGGGGYMMIIAKDAEAATRIRGILIKSPPNNRARFVDWNISSLGLQVTRS